MDGRLCLSFAALFVAVSAERLRSALDFDDEFVDERLVQPEVTQRNLGLRQQLMRARAEFQHNQKSLQKAYQVVHANTLQNERKKLELQRLVRVVSTHGTPDEGQDLGESAQTGEEPRILQYQGPDNARSDESRQSSPRGPQTQVDDRAGIAYVSPGQENSSDELVKRAMSKLQKKHPELGIWAGYRTPDKG